MAIFFDLNFSRIYWCRTSICLVKWWNSKFVVNRIAPILSVLRLTCWPGCLYPRATKNKLIYIAFFLVFAVAIYSPSIENKPIVALCFDCWDRSLLEKRKVYLLVDLCLYWSPAQFKSVYLTNSSVTFNMMIISSSNIPAKYEKI